MNVYMLSDRRSGLLLARLIPLVKQLQIYESDMKINMLLTGSPKVGGICGRFLEALPYIDIKEVYKFFKNRDIDVLMISNLSSMPTWLITKLFKVLNNRNVKIILDLSDPIFLSRINIMNLFSIRTPAFSHLEITIRDSNYVTTSSHFTLSYVKIFNDRAEVIHDPIDVEKINPWNKKLSDKLVIGWEGAPQNHHPNLSMLRRPLMRLAKEYDFKFKIASWAGDEIVKQMFKKLEDLIEVDDGSDNFLLFSEHVELCRDFDILVAPLQHTSWYEGKSALRVGIGMAMGIPIVASPVGEQKYVVKHGVNGFIARNEEEWYNYLRILIEDDNLRRRMGREGRKIAEKELSIEVNGRKLYDIISSLVESN